MVSSWHRFHARFLGHKRYLTFFEFGQSGTRLRRLITESVPRKFLCDHFNQIIRWNKSAISLLNEAAERVRDVVHYIVPILQFGGLALECADRVMASSEELALLLHLSFLLHGWVRDCFLPLKGALSVDGELGVILSVSGSFAVECIHHRGGVITG